MDEIWLPIPGYESRYEVSNLGRVRSFVTGTGSKGAVHYLKQDDSTKYGHRRVTLSLMRATRRFMVHRLVATVFLGEAPSEDHEVNHIDFDPANNRADNLEWVTRQENISHSVSHHPRGTKHPSNKLSECQVLKIRELHSGGIPTTKLAKLFGVSQQTCYCIVKRKIWKHV
jgi:hypothetical protein